MAPSRAARTRSSSGDHCVAANRFTRGVLAEVAVSISATLDAPVVSFGCPSVALDERVSKFLFADMLALDDPAEVLAFAALAQNHADVFFVRLFSLFISLKNFSTVMAHSDTWGLAMLPVKAK